MRSARGRYTQETVKIAAVLLALSGSSAWSQEATPATDVHNSVPAVRDTPTQDSSEVRPSPAQAADGANPGRASLASGSQVSQRPATSLTISPQKIVGLAAALILGAFGLYYALLLVEQIGIGGFVGVETHWGGFGGAGGGWRLSPGLVYLILSLVFIGCGTALAINVHSW